MIEVIKTDLLKVGIVYASQPSLLNQNDLVGPVAQDPPWPPQEPGGPNITDKSK